MPDFVATGIAYRIKIPGGGTDEWYLVENHQRTSVFDIPDNNVPTAKGLFVLRQGGSTGSTVGVIPAQGRFTWTVPYQLPNIYGSNPPNLPVFRRERPSRVGGYTKRQNVPWTWQGVPQPAAAIHYHLDYVTGALRQAPPTIFTGDGQDQFDIGHNTVFTPASNPSTDIYGNANKVGFDITGVTNGIYTMNIHINTVDSASPSKPQDLRISVQNRSGDNRPRLDWAAMQEPDVISGGKMFIHRRIKIGSGSWGSWRLRDSVAGTTTSWEDNDIATAGGGPDSLQYRIQARDSQAKLSVFSEGVSIRWFREGNKIAIGGSEMPKPTTFDLGQNYPNPFNPSTTIKYQLAEDGFVALKVFNVLGQEVATLLSEFQPAGYYRSTFDAEELPSGVYIARMSATNALGRTVYQNTSKLMLMK